MDLRVSAPAWRDLRRILDRSFGDADAPEWGCLALLGINRHPARPALLVAEVIPPTPEAFRRQSAQELIFSASYLRQAVLQARRRALAGIAIFHTHPHPATVVRFSPYDDAEEPELMRNLAELLPGAVHASVVVGRHALCARAWGPDGAWEAMERLIVVGDHLEMRPLGGTPPSPPPSPAALFDRALALTGVGAMAELSRMRVGIVGVSGTGSLMTELLVRAGCGQLLLMDDDIITAPNINRILHSTCRDAQEKRRKVDVLKAALDGLGMPTQIEAIQGTIINRKVAEELRGLDLVVGCVDKDWPRLILSEIAHRYLIPMVDVGTEIGADEAGVQAVNARTSYLAVGRPCLSCSGLVSPERLRLESLGSAEQQRALTEGYSENIEVSAPAVMDLNMRAAAYGMLVIRHLLQPYLDEPLPVHIRENLAVYSITPVKAGKLRKADCRVCAGTAVTAGDCAGPLSCRG